MGASWLAAPLSGYSRSYHHCADNRIGSLDTRICQRVLAARVGLQREVAVVKRPFDCSICCSMTTTRVSVSSICSATVCPIVP